MSAPRTPETSITTAAPPGCTSSDAELLARVLERDASAWDELLRRFRAVMFRCITRVARRYDTILSNEDVNEIFGELCLNLLRNDLRKLRAYDPARGARLSSWLGLLAINTTYDYLRQSLRRPRVDHFHFEGSLDRPSEAPSAFDLLADKQEQARVVGLLDGLTAREQRFFELYYGLGLEPEEIAADMGISVKTVYSKKNKLRTRLLALAA